MSGTSKPFIHEETKRINPQEAFARVNNTRYLDFGPIALEVEDQSEFERTTDKNAVWIDSAVDPSGSIGLYPTSQSIASAQRLIQNRTIFPIQINFPKDDPRGSSRIEGCRLLSLDNDDITEGDNYMISLEWEGVEWKP